MTPQNREVFLAEEETSLSKRLREGFERKLLEAAMSNLRSTHNPLRFNNFAYAIRELVRNVMQRLAPDDEVRRCSWYRDETDKPGAVSRRQRLYFAVQGGLTDDYVQRTLQVDIAETHRALRDAIDRLSKYTHINEDAFELSETEVGLYAGETISAVLDLFAVIDECRSELVESLVEELDRSVLDAALNETILSIDELATHHTLDEVYVEDVTVTRIDSTHVYFSASGTVDCSLQWGSNSDVRNGDGAEMSTSFPFVCEMQSPVDQPSDVEADQESFCVDTSSWREDWTDDE